MRQATAGRDGEDGGIPRGELLRKIFEAEFIIHSIASQEGTLTTTI